MFSSINNAVESIQKTENARKKLISKILPLKNQKISGFKGEIFEEKLAYPVEATELNYNIAGVDSGFVGKNLFSLDLFLVRSAGVMFSYKNNKLVNAAYYPGFFSFPNFVITDSVVREEDFSCSMSLHRLMEEISLSKRIIQKFKPDFLFIDGSIVPQHMDKPRKGSNIKNFYFEIIELFQDLYETAEKNSCQLIACVEDSRGLRFKSILEEILQNFNGNTPKELENTYDAILLDYFLKESERSSAFSYTSSVQEHPVLKDFNKKWAEQIHVFYLKPSNFDRPLRIEFLHKKGSLTEQSQKIASLVYSLSSFHKEYAYPTVLIEADLRARLKPEEINIVYDKISDKLGSSFNLLMRRDRRPF